MNMDDRIPSRPSSKPTINESPLPQQVYYGVTGPFDFLQLQHQQQQHHHHQQQQQQQQQHVPIQQLAQHPQLLVPQPSNQSIWSPHGLSAQQPHHPQQQHHQQQQQQQQHQFQYPDQHHDQDQFQLRNMAENQGTALQMALDQSNALPNGVNMTTVHSVATANNSTQQLASAMSTPTRPSKPSKRPRTAPTKSGKAKAKPSRSARVNFGYSDTNTTSNNNAKSSMASSSVTSSPKRKPTSAESTKSKGEVVSTDSDTDSMDAVLGDNLGSNQMRWNVNLSTPCHRLFDSDMQPIKVVFRSEMDKGFKISPTHDSYICQKKNHFQVTVAAKVTNVPKFVGTPSGLVEIAKTKITLHGVKKENIEQRINLEQSMSNREKNKFESTDFPLSDTVPGVVKATIGRLHFTETTGNNMRKRGQPNPDQKYFALVVSLEAESQEGTSYTIMSYISDRIIVRASNPGQFETTPNVYWLKGRTMESIYYQGSVGINHEAPDEALCVNGNFAMTGTLIQPSDKRVKTNIAPREGTTQLDNLKQMKFYNYSLKDAWADSTGIDEEDRHNQCSVLAQELQQVLPEAVKQTSDRTLADGSVVEQLLIVNKDRLLMEGLGALKQLATEYDALETRLALVKEKTEKLNAIKQKNTANRLQSQTQSQPWSLPGLHSIQTLVSMVM